MHTPDDENVFCDFLQAQVQDVRERLDAPLPATAADRFGSRILVGEGAQKLIYAVQDINCCRQVAMAVLKNHSPEDTAQFLREARLTALLQHPNIMPVYTHGRDEDGLPFFTMKLVSGRTLSTLIPDAAVPQRSTAAGRLSALTAFTRVCEAVSYAHSKGIVHRDLKPDNVQIGEFGEVLLSDWGLAGLDYDCCEPDLLDDAALGSIDLKVSACGRIKGTPGFVAPELLQDPNAYGPKTDQFALGGILHQLLTGDLPMRGETGEAVLAATKAGNLAPFRQDPQRTPDGLKAICNKALRIDPEDRYPSVSALLADLTSYQAGFATLAEEAGFLTRLGLLYNRNQGICNTILLSLAALAVVTAVAFRSILQKEETASRLLLELQGANAARQLLEREAAPSYLARADAAFLNDDLDSAIALGRIAHQYAPDNEDARSLYARTLMARQQFAEAAALTADHNPRLNQIAAEFASRKTGSRLDRDTLMDFLRTLDPDHNRDLAYVYRTMLFEEFKILTDFTQKLDLMREEIRYRNPKVTELHFDGRETDGVVALDLSDNPALTNIYVFEKLGPMTVSRLDLSRTRSATPVNLDRLHQMKIDTLSVRDCETVNLGTIALGLRALDARGAGDVSPWLKGSQIEQLWISGSEFRDYNVLTSMPKLRLLVVDKGRLPASVRRTLPADCKIVEE